MGLTKREREIIHGIILGDGYIQVTGKRNARLRIEHSLKQKEYIDWKYEELKNWMQNKPQKIKRYNPVWKKSYVYYRCQSHSSPELGRMQRRYYNDSGKIVPEDIAKTLKSRLTLAVWFMDDGYLYQRDKMAFIYLPRYSEQDQMRLVKAFQDNFDLSPRVIKKKRGELVLRFKVRETKMLSDIIRPHTIPSMKYKILSTP